MTAKSVKGDSYHWLQFGKAAGSVDRGHHSWFSRLWGNRLHHTELSPLFPTLVFLHGTNCPPSVGTSPSLDIDSCCLYPFLFDIHQLIEIDGYIPRHFQNSAYDTRRIQSVNPPVRVTQSAFLNYFINDKSLRVYYTLVGCCLLSDAVRLARKRPWWH